MQPPASTVPPRNCTVLTLPTKKHCVGLSNLPFPFAKRDRRRVPTSQILLPDACVRICWRKRRSGSASILYRYHLPAQKRSSGRAILGIASTAFVSSTLAGFLALALAV